MFIKCSQILKVIVCNQGWHIGIGRYQMPSWILTWTNVTMYRSLGAALYQRNHCNNDNQTGIYYVSKIILLGITYQVPILVYR